MDIFGRKRKAIIAEMTLEKEDSVRDHREMLRKCLEHIESCYRDVETRPQCLADGYALLGVDVHARKIEASGGGS